MKIEVMDAVTTGGWEDFSIDRAFDQTNQV